MKTKLALLLPFILTACQTIPTISPLPSPATILPTPLPISSPSPVAATTPSPVPASTASPVPVATPIPATPKPIPTAVPTPSPQPTTSNSIVNVPATADLSKVFSALKANTKYVLAPHSSYVVLGTFVVTQPNVTIDLNGSSLSMSPAVGSSSNFNIQASGFDIGNGRISKAFVFLRARGAYIHMHDLVMDSITFGADGKQNNGVNQAYVSDNNLAVHSTLERLTVGITGTVSAYFTSDYFTIKDSTFAGSLGEYCIRSETTSDASMHLPINTIIDNVKAYNVVNLYGKPALGFRMNGGGSVIQNSTFTPSLYLGQGGGATGVGSNVGPILLKNNQFPVLHDPQVGVQDGVIATFESNTFLTAPNTSSIAIATKSKVTLTNNIRKLTVANSPVKKFWSTIFTGSAAPEVTETGTKVVNP